MTDITTKKNIVLLDTISSKYNVISTLIHELRHGFQKEDLGEKYEEEDWLLNPEIPNMEIAAWYSECEIDARIFENENVQSPE